MRLRNLTGLLAAGLLFSAPAMAAPPPAAVVTDPVPDTRFPAGMAAFQLPSHGALLNAVLYRAAGQGLHPALLLLHGFPGNEQNLDLAQAARRAGWHVLTLHYRGSWGSPGAFSFQHCIEDSAAAVAYLRDPDNARRLGIDTRRVAVAGHSMGGMMAARTFADDAGLLGAFLIDPWNIAGQGRLLGDPAAVAAFRANELDGDLPPLAGTSAEALLAEMRAADPAIDLEAALAASPGRRLAILSAMRGLGAQHAALLAAAQKAQPRSFIEANLPTDHSFSDHRIALAAALVDWLANLP